MSSNGIRKQTRYRQRLRHGIAVLRIPVELLSVQESLINAERLTISETLERARVESAVSEIVAEWCAKWH